MVQPRRRRLVSQEEIQRRGNSVSVISVLNKLGKEGKGFILWRVKSEGSAVVWCVKFFPSKGRQQCNCPYFKEALDNGRLGICKHLFAVLKTLGVPSEGQVSQKYNLEDLMYPSSEK